MNRIVQCSVLILLCFASWVQGKDLYYLNLDMKKMAVLFYLSAQCDDGSIRLTGGPNRFEGRVEICEDSSWGQVCAMGWTGLDAKVVCRQLGHSTDNRKLVAISSGSRHKKIIIQPVFDCSSSCFE